MDFKRHVLYSVIFRNMNAQLAQVVHLAVKLFKDMRNYNVESDILSKDDTTGTQILPRRPDWTFIR